MAYRIDPSVPVGDEVRRIAGDLLDAAVGHLRAEPVPSVDDVHDARTALKKLRSLLRLVRDEIGADRWRALDRRLRDAGRTLSAQRDADVAIETLDGLTAEDGSALDAVLATRLRAALVSRAAEARHAAAQEDITGGPPDQLDEARITIGLLTLEGDGFEVLVAGLRRQYRRGRQALDDLGAEPEAEQLHELRKRVKDHWYHLRLLRGAWPPVMKALAGETRELADHLGADHDLWVLRSAVAELHPDLLGERAPEVLAAIDGERGRLLALVRAGAQRAYADRPKAFTQRVGTWWIEADRAAKHGDSS